MHFTKNQTRPLCVCFARQLPLCIVMTVLNHSFFTLFHIQTAGLSRAGSVIPEAAQMVLALTEKVLSTEAPSLYAAEQETSALGPLLDVVSDYWGSIRQECWFSQFFSL